jgi:hypothetical protein
MAQEQTETGCCARFHPEKWDQKAVVWDGKPFVRIHVRSIFHIPIGMDKAMMGIMGKIEAAGAKPKEGLMLSEEKSMWGSDFLISVTKDVPGSDNIALSGKFISKVFEGHYKNMGRWAKEMRAYVASKNKEMKRLYFGYTTCPACAKAYGKNYVVLLAEVEGSIKETKAEEKQGS